MATVSTEQASGFGERLRRLRIVAGLTQEELAARAGVTAKGIAALERGRRRRPYPHTVRALATALGLSDDACADLLGARSGSAAQPTTAVTPVPVMPVPPTPTIGRDLAMTEVLAHLGRDGGRLVTLTGPGGVGKTRLAMVVARQATERFADGVVFVPLAAVTDPALVIPAILASLDLGGRVDQPSAPALAAALQGRRLLLVLDNLEQVLPVAPALANLLDACPDLTILATSRSPLRIRGEREYAVVPLALPELRHIPTRAEVATSDAVQLFVERAQASSPSFELTQDNAAAVAAICRRLDGLPLALELAAARLRLLSPTELLARIDQALPLLAGGARDLPERQRTMRDTIAWSYHLLAPAEQALFRWLSVFVGGWGLAAAEAVGATDRRAGEDMLDRLASLVEQSLVIADRTADDTTRFRMLETIREFGHEQLNASGEHDAVRQHHLAWCLSLAGEAEPELRGPRQAMWLRRLETEHGNFRAALTWAVESSLPEHREQGLRLAGTLWLFWFVRGHDTEGSDWLDRLLAAADECPNETRARALFALGMLRTAQRDIPRATVHFGAGLQMARSVGSHSIEALARFGLGDCARQQGDDLQAVKHYEAALALFRGLDDRPWIASSLNGIAMVAVKRREVDRAQRLTDEALPLLRDAGDTWSTAETLAIAAEAAHLRGDAPRAASLYAEALAAFWDQGDRRASSSTIERLAALAASRGMAEPATRLVAGVDAERAASLPRHTTVPSTRFGRLVTTEARRILGDVAFDRAWAAGQQLALDVIIVEAQALGERLLAEPAPPVTRPAPVPGGLSTREVEVLRLLTAGLTNGEIAQRLFLSEHTIRAHLRRIYHKLDITTRAEAVRFAVEHQLA